MRLYERCSFKKFPWVILILLILSPRGATTYLTHLGWWSGVVVSALASINEVNQRRARSVLRWATVSGFNSGAGHLFRYVTNQPPKANLAVHPSGIGK